jgi:hypothetical protein
MSEKDEETCKDMMKTKGFGWRVSLSIIMGIGWLIFLIVWLFFYASDFNIYQNIAIFIVSILVLGGVLGAAWAPWGMRYEHKFDDKSKKMEEKNSTENKKKEEKEIDKEI